LSVMQAIWERAREYGARIVLPESADERILKAARIARDSGIARPVLVGESSKIRAAAGAAGVALDGLDEDEALDRGRDVEALPPGNAIEVGAYKFSQLFVHKRAALARNIIV